jgi:purine-binding chemotaxis protein CheW
LSDSSKKLSGLEQAKRRALDSQGEGSEATNRSDADLAPFVLMCARGQWYAADAHKVQRVVAKGPITPVPGHPRHILGVTLVNDILVPVIDLPGLTGAVGAPSTTEITPRLVVLGEQDDCVGVIAEEAQGIEELPRSMDGSAKGVVAGEKFWNDRQIAYLDVKGLIAIVNENSEAS